MMGIPDQPQRKLADSIMQAAYDRCAQGKGDKGDHLLCLLDANHQQTLGLLMSLEDKIGRLAVHETVVGSSLQRLGAAARSNAPPALGGGVLVAVVLAILERL